MTFLTKILMLGPVSIPVYYIAIAIIILLCLFLLWFFGIRDGFDKERLFDLFFLGVLAWVAVYFIVNYFYPYDLFLQNNKFALGKVLYLFLNLAILKYFTRKWKWSAYRMLDIFSLVFFILTLSLFVYQILLTKNSLQIVAVFVYTASYVVVFALRNKFFSGLSFSLYLLITSIFGQFFFKSKVHLIFYFALITISMVTILFRTKRAMFTRNLDKKFIQKIKEFLSKKKLRLTNEQQELIEQDPYLQEGRDMGNSEEMDEAILEDRAKVESDIKKDNLEEMEKQVDKALDKLGVGDYGICEVCGEPIDQARLEVYPEATTCVSCAEKQSEQS